MADATNTPFSFPVGYREFNKKPAFNYQLNRYFSMGQARLVDVTEVGSSVRTIEDWKREMLEQAERAVSEGRLSNAATYYRAAEFYLLRDNPEKEQLYDRFISTFNQAFGGDGTERTRVPYSDGFLPVMRLSAEGPESHGTVVIHGGNDSFMEEFYPMLRYFAANGFDVVAFEGPGQGSALKKYGLVLDQEWEKPTRAVLDHFELNDVTLIGISMGGWLCLRAAAHEPRISRAIAWSVSYDVLKYTNAVGAWLAKLMFKHCRGFINNSMVKKARKDVEYSWFIHNLMYITGKSTPIEAFDVLFQFSEENLCSEQVKQDVLILSGKDDHLVPYKMHDLQVKALVNARSVTERVFTAEDEAGSHCQMGNLGLAFAVMRDWIVEKSCA
jgi:alpha-beta hydrolase superfamily lysophospholipase